ncbi:hypothetical protein GMO_18590 [Gluconobacter morbifer G707]|uniref:Uncharacterized protein n=1 Tax=Gluconobacter morbifer G707 TaxID=1088869 RepID=G6XJI7_9PROT|nr:hypothetical protein GMO_18590 [Gluconobacter morbifer G707]
MTIQAARRTVAACFPPRELNERAGCRSAQGSDDGFLLVIIGRNGP